MTRHTAILVLALGSSVSMPRSATATAAPPPEPTAVRLEVEVEVAPETSLPADDETWKTMRTWVTGNQTTVLEDAGFIVSDDAAHVIRTELHVYGDYGVNTKGTVTVVGDASAQREFVCEACKDSEILAKIDDETEVLTEHLRATLWAEHEHAQDPGPTTEPDSTNTDEREGDDPAKDARSRDRTGTRIGPVGYAGIGALAVGLGATIGGAIVLAEDPEQRLQATSARFIETVHRRPLGAALTGIGAGLLVTGAVLVAVDQTVLRKRRSSRRTATMLTPSLQPNGAGLSWAGRF